MNTIEEVQDLNYINSITLLNKLTLKQAEFELRKQLSGLGKDKGSRRERQNRINTLTMLISKKQSQRLKSGWIEVEYQTLPPGTVFKAYVSLDDGKRNNKRVFGSEIGSIRQFAKKASQQCLMKSSGTVCILLSPGMDQGSLLTLPAHYMVWVKQPKRMLASDGANFACHMVDNDMEDDDYDEI